MYHLFNLKSWRWNLFWKCLIKWPVSVDIWYRSRTSILKLSFTSAIDWPAVFSASHYRVMAIDGHPAGGGHTHSAVPSIEAFSLRTRIGTSRLVSSPLCRSVSKCRSKFNPHIEVLFTFQQHLLVALSVLIYLCSYILHAFFTCEGVHDQLI